MSMYRGHLLGGLMFYVVVIALSSVWHNMLIFSLSGLIATLAGSLFPDIDISSAGQNLFLKILFLVVVLCLFLQASIPLMVLLGFSVLPLLFPHRGLFHDLYFILALVIFFSGAMIYTIPMSWRLIVTISFFFLLGVLSHLILDKGMRKTFRH